MNVAELLSDFDRHAVRLEVRGDRLRCSAPQGFLTPERRDALSRHKAELIALLSGTGPEPAAFVQRPLWFLDRMAPGNPFYNNPAAFELLGPLDVPALQRALAEVVRRHQSLRTVFAAGAGAGEVDQLVRPAEPIPLPVIDVGSAADADRLAEAEAVAPFDLAHGPLLRSRLLRLASHRHRWLLTVHHIVADGWSIGLLLGELAVLYEAFSHDQPSPLPEPAAQYRDYARWQRQLLTGPERDRLLRYWTAALAGAPGLLALPTDRSRPLVQRFRGRRDTATVPAAVGNDLRRLANQTGSTLFTVLTAALSVLLWRYSGQADISIGTPFAGRNRSELEGLIGHFVNTVVVRTELDPLESFTGLLARVRDRVLAAHEHAELPFDQVVEALAPERHAGHSPLFQVMLVLQNMPLDGLRLPGLAVAELPAGTGASRFDLSVEVTPEPGGALRLDVEYDTDLFEPATARRMVEHLQRLLVAATADPGRPVHQLELLSAEERRRQLEDRTGRATVSDSPDLISRFAHQVRCRPAALAVLAGADRLSYAELDRRSNRLARGLLGRGVGPGGLVGLRLSGGADLFVALLGVLKTGAGYLPLDPALPAGRIEAIVADARPVLVLSAGGQLRELLDPDDGPLPPVVGDLAYVIYTSGSTGRPKGVAVGHESVANLLDSWTAEFGPDPLPSALWSSIGFDVSVHEIFLPLTTGGSLQVVPEPIRADPRLVLEWLAEHRIASAYLPPAFIRWIDEDPAGRLTGCSLRRLLVGVEPLSELALHRITEQVPGLRILNGYGPTEATVYATGYPDPQPIGRQCPIGRPLRGNRAYLLDRWQQPVPLGVIGELYLGGAGLARCYWGRPAETADRFVPDPYRPGERLYRTGDLARQAADGSLTFVGRNDDQVKLRGFRIEPAEIEAALRRLPGVRDAAVLVDRGQAEPRLLAGIARTATDPLRPDEWRGELARRLPSYLVPAVLVERPELPLTASGKLDRAALIAFAQTGVDDQVNQASPRDQVELALYELWRRVLRQPRIGIGDDFFAIGGTSVSAIKLVSLIEDELGVRIPVAQLMVQPSIEALAGRIRGERPLPAPGSVIEFRAGAGDRRLVCVHPAGGTAFCYLSLATVLPAEVGVWGIQSPGVNPGEQFLPDVEAMAAHYLELIGDQRHGRLVLTGLSYGGLIAYEMGRRLTEAGCPDVTVVLLDTQGSDDRLELQAIEPVDFAEFKDKLVRFNGMYEGIEDAQVEQYFHIYNHNRLSMRDYRARPSTVRLVLIEAVAGRGPAEVAAGRQFWGRRAERGLSVTTMDCDHWELLESDEVLRVAEVLRAELGVQA